MPDQSSAASEHAIMEEITAPLVELPDDPVASISDQDFPIVLRGYDRLAVDDYVKRVTQLVAELYATRSPEGAVRRALVRVGEEVSAILQRAHVTAERLTSQSRKEAEERLIRARDEADEVERHARASAEEIERAAHERVRELDADVDKIWAERERIVADVRKLSDELERIAGAAASRFPAASTEEAEAIDASIADEHTDAQVVSEPEPTVRFSDEREAEPEQPAEAPTATHERLHEYARLIDLMHLGNERVIGCWQVGDVLIDPGPASCLITLLDALGDERPRALLLTHIHLDHAGASGSLVKRWPDLEVYVHERGAPHMMDPSRLLQSAERLYGDDMERLWGEVLPVPSANIRLLRGGESLIDDQFEVAYTPGHASHHVSYLHDGTAYVGDVAGVRITPETLTIPPTPPPDIDVEAWHRSIELVAAWKPERLAMTHFGSSDDVHEQLGELSGRLDKWADLARHEELDQFVSRVREEIEQNAGPELLKTYVQAAPPEQLYAGLERYWHKRAEQEGAETGTSDAPDSSPLPAAASTHAGRATRPDS